MSLRITSENVFIGLDDRAAKLSDLAKGATAANTAVYKPGGVDEGNVYSTWPAALAALVPVAGPKIVFIDDSIQSPALVPSGTYDLTNTKLEGNSATLAATSQLQFEDGAVLEEFDGFLDLSVFSVSTSPVSLLSGTETIMMVSSSITVASGSAPFFQIADGATGAVILTLNSQFIDGTGGTSVYQNLNVSETSNLALNMFSNINDNTLEDIVGATPITLYEDSSGVVSHVQPQLNTPVTIVHVDASSNVFYSGDHLPVNNVHDAIDYLVVTGTNNEALTTVSGYLQNQVDGIDASIVLQDAYDNGTGIITTVSGKDFELAGVGALTAVTGTFTEGLTVGTGTLTLTSDNIYIGLDDRAAKISDLKKGATAANTAVYKPGGVDEGNVYSTWAAALAALSPIAGPKIVFIDDSVESPALVPSGTYDLTNIKIEGNSPTILATSQLQFEDGAVLEEFDGLLDLTAITNSSSPVAVLSGTETILLVSSTVREAAGAAPFFEAVDQTTSVIILTLNSIFLTGPAGESVYYNTNTVPTSRIALSEFSHLNENTLSDTIGAGSITVYEDASGVISDTQTGLNTPPIITHLDNSASVFYTGSLPVDNVHDAIDYLAVTGTSSELLVAVSGHLQSEIGSIDSNVTLQDAYDNGDGTITVSDSKYFTLAKAGNQALFLEATSNNQVTINLDSNGTQKGLMGYNDIHNCVVITHSETGTAKTDAALIVKEGDVGIGTTDPSERLDVVGNGTFTGDLIAASGTFTLRPDVSGDSVVTQSQIDSIDSSVTLQEAYDNGDGVITTASGKDVAIMGTESLGIGTAPSTRLHVSGAGDQVITLESSDDNQATVNLHSNGTQKGLMGYNETNNCVVITHSETGTSKTDAALIVKEGQVGIGTLGPTEKLHVVGSGTFTGDIAAASGTFTLRPDVSGDSVVTQSQLDSVDNHSRYTNSESIAALEPTTSALAASGAATDANIVSVSGHLQSGIDGIDSSVTLQEAYDNGTGIITTTAGKPLDLQGTGELTAVTGTFTTGLISPQVNIDVVVFNDGATQNTGSTPDGIGFHPSAMGTSVQSASLTNEDTLPLAIFVRPDGLKLYMSGNETDDVHEYDMGEAWNLSTLSFVQSAGISLDAPRGLYFKTDGTKFYVMRFTGFVVEFTMTTPWDITSSSQTGVFGASGGFQVLTFKADGMSFYALETGAVLVKRYDMAVAWDIDTASDPSISFDPSNETSSVNAVTFRPDGRSMYVADSVTIYEYELPTPWDITTAKLIDSGPSGFLGEFFFKPDGTKIIALDQATDLVHEFSIGISTSSLVASSNVGIGTSSPSESLDVVGSGTFSGDLTAASGTLTNGLTAGNTVRVQADTGATVGFVVADDTATDQAFFLYNDAANSTSIVSTPGLAINVGVDIDLNCTGNSGDINLTAATATIAGAGGSINLLSGNGLGTLPGGNAFLTAGLGGDTGGAGGNLFVSGGGGGDNDGEGGILSLEGGQGDATGNSDGGDVDIRGGQSFGTGTHGDVLIASTGGSVGVGTSTPSGILHLQIDDTFQGGTRGLTLENINSAASADVGLAFKTDSHQENLWQIFLDNSLGSLKFGRDNIADYVTIQDVTGNVGIGTEAPSSKLDVVGSGTFTEDLIIDGNVGIGTTSPAVKLDVQGDGNFNGNVTVSGLDNTTLRIDGDTAGFLRIGDLGASDNDKFFDIISDDGGLLIRALNNDAEGNPTDSKGNRIIIDSSGNVSVGQNSSGARFHVTGSGNVTGDLIIDGNVGIGTPSPSTKLDVNGVLTATAGDIPELYNSLGDLKIQPDVQGDVILFGDTDIGDAVDGKELRIWRRAVEGDEYVRAYITSTQNALIHSNANMIFQNSSGKNIQFNSGQHIYLNLGDSAGSDEVRIRDNGGLEVGTVDSNGNTWFRGDVSVGVSSDVLIQANGDTYFNGGKVGIGTATPSERLEVVGSGTFSGDVFVAGNVGIGTVSPDYQLSVASTGPALQLKSTRTVMGTGYEVGAIKFFAGELVPTNVGEIKLNATEDWTDTSSPTRMSFHTTDVGSINSTTRMIIDEEGKVGIGTLEPSESLEVVGSGIFNGDLTVEESTIGTPASLLVRHSDGTSGISHAKLILQTEEAGGGDPQIYFLVSGQGEGWTVGVDNSDTDSFKISNGAALQSNTRIRIDYQGNVSIGAAAPTTSAKLEIESTTGALLLPRMTTTQRDNLTAVNGMIIYNTSTDAFNFYENGSWVTK